MRKLQKSWWHLKKMKNEVGPLKVTVKGQKGVFLTEDEEIEDDVNVQKDVQNKKDKRSHEVKEDKSKSLLRRKSPNCKYNMSTSWESRKHGFPLIF